MLHLSIATDLLTSLDELIALLDDDPVLVPALQRERSRLLNHLLGQLIASGRSPARPSAARLPMRPLHGRGGRHHIWSRFWRLRGASYRALAAGCLSSRRFDSLMLLALRGARRRGAQTSSSSPPSPESCEESAGAGAGTGADSGSTGWLMTGGCAPWPSRTKRISDSTMRVCA